MRRTGPNVTDATADAVPKTRRLDARDLFHAKYGRDWLIQNRTDGSVLALIPEGEFIAGGEGEDEGSGEFKVYLPAYHIALHPVTNAQYARFLTKRAPSGSQVEEWIRLDSHCFVRKAVFRYKAYGDKDDHPVVQVSWYGAKAYCEWAGLRLPTELEWERAARGVDGREYPWGDDWEDGRRCRHGGHRGEETTCGAWEYPEGCSPWGLYNMSGNVDEWCEDWRDDKAYARYKQGDLTTPASDDSRVVRGGSWCDTPSFCRAARRGGLNHMASGFAFGFRVAARAREAVIPLTLPAGRAALAEE